MKKMALKSFAKKGDAIVQMNYNAIDSAEANLVKIEVPESWKTTTEGAPWADVADNKYFKEIVNPILKLEGDKLPSSAFNADGTVPTGTTKFEKRGVAVTVPNWNKDKPRFRDEDPRISPQQDKCRYEAFHLSARPLR